ncbi:MAG TPA: DUF6177 family protein [Streptosporangiaceae bacterium]
MTRDVVALVQGRPDPRATVAAMVAAGADLRVRHAADGAVLQLCDPAGPPLVSIEVPLLLQVPGEIERLLGAEIARHVPLPAWWVEARAVQPAASGPAGSWEIADRFAGEMTRLLGGRVWRGAAGPAPPAAESGGREPAEFPGADLVTERAAIVAQHRPMVPLTAWLADALRRCGESKRTLQILTPPDARLTLPLRLMLAGQGGRWVVRGRTRIYDGLTGATLNWDGASFTTPEDETGRGAVAADFTTVPVPVGEQLICTFRALHPAAEDTRIGSAVELLCEALTGAPPGGWGTAEPATQPWHRGELTAFCRDRAPHPTWLVVVGGLAARRAVGTLLVSRTPDGVEESVTLAVGGPHGGAGSRRTEQPEPPALTDPAQLAAVAGRVVTEAGVESLFAQRAVGGEDASTVPHWTGIPGPVGLALSARAVREIGLERALRPPDVPVTRIGGPGSGAGGSGGQAVWYGLGDGVSPESRLRLHRLTQHLSGGGPLN